MPFTANYNGSKIVSFWVEENDWIKIKDEYKLDGNNLTCRECGGNLIPKTRYTHNTYFFAHYPLDDGKLRECLLDKGIPSLEHMHIQKKILDIIKSCGYKADVEVRLADGSRRADIMVEDNIVIEIQNISITESLLNARIRDYTLSGKKVVWFFIKPKDSTRSNRSKMDYLLDKYPNSFEIGIGYYQDHPSLPKTLLNVWASRNTNELWAMPQLLPRLISFIKTNESIDRHTDL